MTGEWSSVPREARPYQGQHAGLASRFLAGVVDGVFIAGLVLIGYLFYAGFVFLLGPLSFDFPTMSISIFLFFGATLATAYFTFTWSGTRRSYGDHLLGLRVVTDNGEQMRPLRAFIRAIMCVLVPIGLIWALVSQEKRSVQDLIVRTTVIYDWRMAHMAHLSASANIKN
ncbi:MAG: RDD family protein [Longispora sp.]|nr:RDD family protein [Longispora sp. (in: high G+C Gram-positive bacteria)]